MVDEILSVFPDARVNSGYVRIRCPYHKDGHENKPSMSILLEPRGGAPAGLCHCFACGKKVMLDTLLKDVGADVVVTVRNTARFNKSPVTLITEPKVAKVQLPYKKSQYLLSRGIGEEVQRRFKIFERDGKVHMPVFTRDGFYLYDNARSTTEKRFFVETGAKKSLWGIEEIDMARPICVCESQIDALSLWQIGCQAVATLGADNISCLSEIKKCTSLVILAFDPDDAGLRARERASNMLGKFRCRYIELPSGVDINKALQDIQDESKFKNFILRSVRSFVQ